MKKTTVKLLNKNKADELLSVLEARFLENMKRHKGLSWGSVRAKLVAAPQKLASLEQMEITGGEPDVVSFDKKTGEFVFMDCAAESPKRRRSCCYDEVARKARKENAPEASAAGMALRMGVTLLSEEEYQHLQSLGDFDLKTSSWLLTPEAIRARGGALFGDKRYNHTFTYHNGADSYYAVRGFRASLRV